MAALQIRASNFKYMLHSFPQGYLSRDLLLLVQRSLIDVCEQLTRLDAKNAAYKQDLQAVTQQMNETWKQQPQPAQAPALESPQQVKEIKQCLEDLYKVIYQQEARNILNNREAEVHRSQIRQLMLGATVDAYVMHGHLARQREKPRLAEHYFGLAHKLLVREDATGVFDSKKARLQSWLDELASYTQQLQPAALTTEDTSEQAKIDKAWEKFAAAEEGWKKKNLYD